jgi:hypothetical protein
MTMKTLGALARVAFWVWGFFWGVMHANETNGLFVMLMCCLFLYGEYRQL